MFKRLFSGVLIFGMAATAPPGLAQQNACAARDSVTDKLRVQFEEQQTGLGLQSPTKLVELWTAPDSGSWTILLTLPNGISCVLATGQYWTTAPTGAMEDLGPSG